ncbi:MAG TPA: formyltransferase [Candidatus Binataceae bacterium]|nr:formyltransferase [Candidatus Binataceae bacterium]
MSDKFPASMTAGGVRAARCVLFAYHEIGYACMAELIAMGAPIAALFTHADAAGEEIWWRSCAELAAANGIPVYTPATIGAAEIATLRRLEPAIIYSFYYRNLLSDAVLQTAPKGAYNLHGSMLPKYRGRVPVNWMIVNGETEGGVTLHHMVARADAGDIVAQRAIAIDDADTALTLYRKLIPAAMAILRECHPLIVAGSAPRRAQDLRAGSYYGRRRPEDGRIDWRWPARRIHNLVRAVTRPYPGAFCDAGGRKLFIWEARIAAESGSFGEPGAVVSFHADGAVEVAAGAGSLLIRRVQFEGESEASGRDLLSALPNYPTVRLE